MKSASAAKQATKRNENSHAELVLPGPRVEAHVLLYD